MRFLAGLLASVFSISACAINNEAAHYATNPNFADSAIFVSGTGLTRLDYDELEPSWHTLEGVYPFEPVVTNTAVLVGSRQGVFAVSVEDGALLWHLPAQVSLYTPTVIGDTAFAGGEDGNVRAIDLATGQERWRHQLSGWVFSPAVVQDVLVTGGEQGTLWALGATDGEVRWQRNLGEDLIFRPIAARDDPVYVSTVEGTVAAIAVDDGGIRWQVRQTSPSSTALDDERLYLGHFDGLVTAHDRHDGHKLWEYRLNAPTTLPVRLLNGKVIAISDDGSSVMLDPSDGRVLEELSHPLTDPEPVVPVIPDGDELLAVR